MPICADAPSHWIGSDRLTAEAGVGMTTPPRAIRPYKGFGLA